MDFTVAKSIDILERTPGVLSCLLQNVSDEWSMNNEGGESWSAYDIMGHLIHGEQTDWIPRATLILSENADKTFKPFNRFAQFENSKGKTLSDLLAAFSTLRAQNLIYLKTQTINTENLEAKGIHPVFGEVSLSQLLATWVVHDLNHIAQISRVMAKQYQEEVGPWVAYLSILNK